MDFEIPITVAVSIISIVFILYRLLIKINEQHINMLRDELSIRVKPEEELKEQQDIYNRKLDRLKLQLENTEFDKAELKNKISEISKRIIETENVLNGKDATLEKMSEVFHRNNIYLSNNLKELEERCSYLEAEKLEKIEEYSNLVKYIKHTFGEDSLLEYHYSDDSITKIKRRRSINRKKRHKSYA